MCIRDRVSITAGIPMTVPYAAFVIGFGLIAVAAVVVAIQRRFSSAADSQGSNSAT